MKKLLKWVLLVLAIFIGIISLSFILSEFFILGLVSGIVAYGCAIGFIALKKLDDFEKLFDKHKIL